MGSGDREEPSVLVQSSGGQVRNFKAEVAIVRQLIFRLKAVVGR